MVWGPYCPLTLGVAMSQTVTWLLGLIGLLILTFLCVSLHASDIEAEMTRRVEAAFAGVPGATAEVSGRDVVLRGSVPTTEAAAEAAWTAWHVPGVRRVHNDLNVTGGAAAEVVSGAGVSPFTLSQAAGALVLRGVVPNGAVRTSLLARVREAFPGREVRDELTLDAGARADWEASLLALLGRIRGVNRPALSIEPGDGGAGGVVVLSGAVPTEADKAEVETAARAAVAAPYTLRSDLIVEDPAIGDQLEVSGSTDADVVAAEEAFREALSIGQIEFASGTNDLTPQSREILDRVAAVLTRVPTVGADVQGHTDAQGGEAANQALSQERAEAVEAYLLAQGVADDALTATGFGEGQPIASNDTADGRARNRRVVFALRRL